MSFKGMVLIKPKRSYEKIEIMYHGVEQISNR
jgi:hypothetical protein